MKRTTQVRGYFRPESANDHERTVELVFATEAKVLRQNEDGSRFYEVLPMDPKRANLERLNRGAALLDNHNRNSVHSQLGVIEKGWIDPKKRIGLVTARFSSHPEIDRIWHDVRSGIIQNVSFAYTVESYMPLSEYQKSRSQEEKEEDEKRDEDESQDKPKDESKDEENQRENDDKDADDKEEREDEEEKSDEDAEEKRENIPVLVARQWSALEVSMVCIPADPSAKSRSSKEQIRSPMSVQSEEINERALDQAMHRVLEIQEIARTAGLPKEVESRYLKSKLAMDEIRKDAFKEMAKLSNTIETPSILPGSQDEGDTRRQGMEDALLHRSNPHKFKIDDTGKRFAKMSLLSLAKRSLESTGTRAEFFSNDEILSRSMHGNSEFPMLLMNVVNKTLRSDYEAAPQIWRSFTRIMPAKDFRPIYRMQLGDMPLPALVDQKEESKRATLSESGTSYRVQSYEKIISFTRQLMIDDDIGFLSTIPGKIGLACAELESNIVLNLILSNPLMPDGKTLFHADHNNVLTGGNTIDIETTSLVRSMMRRHVGLDGRKLNITPSNYIVPTALETLAEQFISQNLLANQAMNVNPFAGKLGVLCDARFDDSSTTDWYMIAQPSQVDIIEAAFLGGAEGPKIETRYGFEVSGMDMKVTHDFGAGILDYRGILKVEGKGQKRK